MRIIKALKHNSATLYGERKINPTVQKVRSEQSERLFAHQDIRRRLAKLTSMLQEMDNYQDSTAADRARQNKVAKELEDFVKLIAPDARREIFADKDLEAIWNDLNTIPDHRRHVVDWLEAKLVGALADETNQVMKRFQAWKIQETYRTSKSAAMRRFINKKESPPCQIEEEKICQHFRKTWSPPDKVFFEAEVGTLFDLEEKLPNQDVPEEMTNFMLSRDDIKAVLRSRDDISACGNDDINYRIIKAAGPEAIKFMRRIIRATIRCGRVFESWKEPRIILICTKGDRQDPKNWRPITITNCAYRVYTCLMARSFQRMNARFKIFNEAQIGFLQKTNECNEHRIILNELFHDAQRKQKDLIVTAIDFTNAFGSIPHEFIMLAIKQLKFPQWVSKVIGDMYTDAKSTIEDRGMQTQPIMWRKGVKQGCPLNPLLFNICLEPSIKVIRANSQYGGTYLNTPDENMRFDIQAYEDDFVFLSHSVEKGWLTCWRYCSFIQIGRGRKSIPQSVLQLLT
jgi:hypothetical protein